MKEIIVKLNCSLTFLFRAVPDHLFCSQNAVLSFYDISDLTAVRIPYREWNPTEKEDG